MNDEDKARIEIAIKSQGTSRHITPSGSILDLLTEFAREEKLAEMAQAFIRFQSVNRLNAGFVQESVPGKVLNWYFVKGAPISFSTFDKWAKSEQRKNWAEQIKNALANATQFESLVRQMRDELLKLEKSRAA
jgi:hypothetical protein